MNRTDKAG